MKDSAREASSNFGLTLAYSFRHLMVRRLQTGMAVMGVALVVFVFTATLMLSHGLRQTLSATGSPNNAIVFRTGAQNEIQSGVDRPDAAVVLAQPEIARDADGAPRATTDSVVLVSLIKRSDGLRSNVNVRGVGGKAQEVRRGVQVTAGRVPVRGTREVMVGSAIHKKFQGTDVGETLRLVGTDWEIVGLFDAGNSAFNSEIWGDVDVMLPAFHRDRFSSVTFELAPGADFDVVRERLQNDRRISVTVERESVFYENQSKTLAAFIRILGLFISTIFSIGAIIGAMITMYGTVASRTHEIGILRALGFSRFAIFQAFSKECMLIGLLGGIVGVACATVLPLFRIATTNFSTFSEIGFGFTLTPMTVCYALGFSVLMGLLGGALPAFRASRMGIVKALRTR